MVIQCELQGKHTIYSVSLYMTEVDSGHFEISVKLTAMQTVTIRTNNAHALRLIEDLEALNLIEVVTNITLNKNGKKLSERLSGSVNEEQAKQMHKELKEMRSFN